MTDTSYAMIQHEKSGEVWALRTTTKDDPDRFSGVIVRRDVCGPLHYSEQDADFGDYNYDDDADDFDLDAFRILRTA